MSGVYFLYCYENIPAGAGFEQFDRVHLAWLAISAAAVSALCAAYRRMDDAARRRCLLALASAMLAAEILKQTVLVVTGSWRVWYLPLHLCGINIFVCLAYALRPSRFTAEVLYAACLPGALIALLCPDWTELPAWNFMHIHSFAVHILLAAFPLAVFTSGERRPDVRRLWQAAGFFAGACVPLYFFNKVTGSNFMYLNGTGEGNPLVWVRGFLGDPGYILGIPVFAAGIWTAMYLPWTVKTKSKTKTQPQSG